MKKHDDYIAGPHHYWIHFWCGLVCGAGVGAWRAWIGSQIFAAGWLLVVAAIVFSLGTAYSCGRWGDRAWHWILQRLPWFS